MEPALTSALIIRSSPAVAVCRSEKNTRMWLRRLAKEDSGEDVAPESNGGEKGPATLANSNSRKITFLLSLSSTKKPVSFASFCSLLFFFLPPSVAHNSEHYIMAALKHWSGFSAGQDSAPPPCALCLEYCTGLNCLTVAKQKMPPPPSLQSTGSRVIQGFFPPFLHCVRWLPPFNFCLSPSWGSSPVVQSTHLLRAFHISRQTRPVRSSDQLSNGSVCNGRVLFWTRHGW